MVGGRQRKEKIQRAEEDQEAARPPKNGDNETIVLLNRTTGHKKSCNEYGNNNRAKRAGPLCCGPFVSHTTFPPSYFLPSLFALSYVNGRLGAADFSDFS